MTDYKEFERESKHRSLYFGLLYNIVIGVLLAVMIFCIIAIPATQIINYYYATPNMKANRRGQYLNSLQNYVISREITLDTSDEIGGWVRENPYVYLLVYQETDKHSNVAYPVIDKVLPGETDMLSELAGSRIDENLDRDELIAAAVANGYYKIKLMDGSVIVALNEYTERLYYASFYIGSAMLAVLTFILVLVRYIRVIIERIKRFQGDVTIVSEIDMDYEIISEGKDEIAHLSGQVETMRRRMLEHIKSEQEAREANTELITSISHDIRTPLTVLMGYIEMMKEREVDDKVMQSYIEATENTALRLKNLSDDMFKYSLAFGDTSKSVRLEEYDFITLSDQLFAEHFVLMREKGYDICVEKTGNEITEGTTVFTDAPNLMRIVDNVFSNLVKYADPDQPILFRMHSDGKRITLTCENSIKQNTEGAESNGIGLKTCMRLGSLVSEGFKYYREEDKFYCTLALSLKPPKDSIKE